MFVTNAVVSRVKTHSGNVGPSSAYFYRAIVPS